MCQPKSVFIGFDISPGVFNTNAASSNSGTMRPEPNQGSSPPFTPEFVSSEYLEANCLKSSPLCNFSYNESILLLATCQTLSDERCGTATMICATFTSPRESLLSFTLIKW